MDFARGALEKALGPRKAQGLLDRVTSTTTSGFYMLRNVDPNQIIPFLSKEHPQTISLILSQLEATQAAGVLNGLPEEMQADVSFRIAQMENISPQVLRELEDTLAQERILGNMSERVGTMLREEMEFSGPVRMSDVEEVQLRIVQIVRQLEEAGQITIVRGDSTDQFV